MLKLSKLADYAVVVLARLSCGDAVQTSPGIAVATSLPEPTVAKVLKGLATGGLVISQRGARGGYRLARTLDSINVADVIAAIDGPVHLTSCVEGARAPCEAKEVCSCGGGWDRVNEAVMQALSTISVADIAAIRPPSQADFTVSAPSEPSIPAE